MKKVMSAIIICIVFLTSVTCAGAVNMDNNMQSGFMLQFNGEAIDGTSLICNNVHYVPMRKIFQKMGAVIFYRSRDSQVLALSRNGDEISHIVGSNIITVNGEQKTFQNQSVSENNETYIPLEMLTATLYPDGILCDNRILNIQKQFLNNQYHAVIKDVLDLCKSGNFYPERFQRYINYHVSNPDCSIQDVIIKVNLGLDRAFYENIKTIEHPNELLVLVNKHNKLPAGFSQYNLVNMDRKYTINDGKQYLLVDVAYEKYVQMWDAAAAEGLWLHAVSTYRTEDYQRWLYSSKVRVSGKTHADNYSARAGHSEHQTGLAVDICSTQVSFENRPEFKWLQNHAHEYGFILRYPKGKEWITGYSYEPWHYRFVGTDVANIIYNEGITYEEYYAKYISVIEFR